MAYHSSPDLFNGKPMNQQVTAMGPVLAIPIGAEVLLEMGVRVSSYRMLHAFNFGWEMEVPPISTQYYPGKVSVCRAVQWNLLIRTLSGPAVELSFVERLSSFRGDFL